MFLQNNLGPLQPLFPGGNGGENGENGVSHFFIIMENENGVSHFFIIKLYQTKTKTTIKNIRKYKNKKTGINP